MFRFFPAGLGFSLLLGTTAIITLPTNIGDALVEAVELADGMTAFLVPPQFVAASTSHSSASQRHATYFFTIDLPENAGEPLQKVVIAPQNLPRFLRSYRVQATRAFEGSRFSPGTDLSLGSVSEEPETKAVTVVFDQPVSPGRRITIALQPQHNPRSSGIYIFRITTFPSGENPQAYIAGHARISITPIDIDD